MLERFIKILRNAGFEDVTAEEIAEIILLADYLPSPEAASAESIPDDVEKPVEAPPAEPPAGSAPAAEPKSQTEPEPAKPVQQEAALFDQDAETVEQGEGVDVAPFRAPRADPLPGARKIVRAMRPLRRRHPSTRRFVLDEEKTVRRIGDGGPFSPVLKPAPEAWLEVALVFDESMSMRVWRQMLDQLQILFERCGFFRDVRTWRLNTETGEAKLYRTAAAASRSRPTYQPGELLDPSGRRLIVVVSDCHAQAWHSGSAYHLMHGWAVKGPVAL